MSNKTKLERILFEEGISQRQLCRIIADIGLDADPPQVGIDPAPMCLIVRGQKKNITINTMNKIINGLNKIIGYEKYSKNDLF